MRSRQRLWAAALWFVPMSCWVCPHILIEASQRGCCCRSFVSELYTIRILISTVAASRSAKTSSRSCSLQHGWAWWSRGLFQPRCSSSMILETVCRLSNGFLSSATIIWPRFWCLPISSILSLGLVPRSLAPHPSVVHSVSPVGAASIGAVGIILSSWQDGL